MRRSETDNYYNILAIPPTADGETIRRAYKELAQRWHPDRNPGNRLAEEQIKQINEAYAVLRHPFRRRLHDLLLAHGGDVRRASRPGERLAHEQHSGVSDRMAAENLSRLHLMRWEAFVIRWILRTSVWLFTCFHVQLLSLWFWLVSLVGGIVLFLVTWPASLALFILLILLASLLQGVLMLYVYVRLKMGRRN